MEPAGYIIIKTHNRIANGPNAEFIHHVMFALTNEDDMFDNLGDALIKRSKKEHAKDYIILPYW